VFALEEEAIHLSNLKNIVVQSNVFYEIDGVSLI